MSDPTNESSEGSFALRSSRAGGRRPEQDEVGEALVEKEQNGRKVVHQPPRDFSSLAPQEDSTPTAKAPRLEDKGEGNGLECAVDPSSGQEVLSGPNSPSSTPVPVVDGGANATLLFSGGQVYKLLGEMNDPGMGVYISSLNTGKMMRYPPKEQYVFTEDVLLGRHSSQ